MINLTEKEKSLGWKVSTAHEWVQSLPLSASQVECVSCGLKTRIGNWDVPECAEHIVGANSGVKS